MHFGSIALNANVFVFAVFGLFVGCGILFGEARLKKLTIGFLVGLFVADQLADFVVTQLAHASVTINDPSLVKLILMLAAVVPLSIGKTPSAGGRFTIRSIVLAVLAAATVVAYTSNFVSIEVLQELQTEYNLIAIATDNHSWWLAGLLVWLIVLHVWRPKSKDEDEGKGKKGKKK